MRTPVHNPAAQALKLRKPFNIFHTHVLDRKIMDAAIAAKKSLEVDIAITAEGSIYVGHPLSFYTNRNLPSPNNLPLDDIVREAKAAGLFLILDLKNIKTVAKAKEIVTGYGPENCLIHAFSKELSFRPWPAEVEAIKEPNWEQEELPLDKLLDLSSTTGVPLALSCHGLTMERLGKEGEGILGRIVAIARRGILSISLSMPLDEETPLAAATNLIENGILPMIRFDETTPRNRPEFFLGFTDYLERATNPKHLTEHIV
jgi:hypothetical protein